MKLKLKHIQGTNLQIRTGYTFENIQYFDPD